MTFTAPLRPPAILVLALALLNGARAFAADDDFFAGVPAAEFWTVHDRNIDGVASFEVLNRKLMIEMPGKSMADSYGKQSLRVAGRTKGARGPEESDAKRPTFRWTSRYTRGVLTLDLDGYKLLAKDGGNTLHVGGKKINVDGKRAVKVTLRTNGTVDVDPKEAILP